MATVGNVLWFLLLQGPLWALVSLIFAGIFAITIIGLPIARACLEFAKLAFAPFGKAVVRDTELLGDKNVSGASKVISTILNIIWFPFGLVTAISYFLLGVSFCVTLIGIPFGIVYFRMGKFIFLPIGKRVVSKKQAFAAAAANEMEKRMADNASKQAPETQPDAATSSVTNSN